MRHRVEGARDCAEHSAAARRTNCESESRNDVAGSKGTWIPSSLAGTCCCLRCIAAKARGVTAESCQQRTRATTLRSYYFCQAFYPTYIIEHRIRICFATSANFAVGLANRTNGTDRNWTTRNRNCVCGTVRKFGNRKRDGENVSRVLRTRVYASSDAFVQRKFCDSSMRWWLRCRIREVWYTSLE